MAAHIVSEIVVPTRTPAPSKIRLKSFLVRGVGTNDSPNPIWVDGKNTKTYATWGGMLERCYCPKYLALKPSYQGCTVTPEWLRFSVFESWMLRQDFIGNQLDKDLLYPGNKVYGPDTCVFVSRALNCLLIDSSRSRGELPLGTSYNKPTKKHIATVCCEGTNKHLGLFLTPLEAHKAWQLAKAEIIEQFPTTDPRIRKALDLRVAQLRDDHANNRITTKL